MMSFKVVDVDAEDLAPWWLFLVTGIAWLIFAFVILSFSWVTVWSVAVLAGIVFIAGGITELMIGRRAPGWRWLYYLMGIIGIIAGVIAFVWPGQTYLVLAAILGWYLLFRGIFDIVNSLMHTHMDMWWLELLVGIAELLIGFWAVGYTGRSAALLALWVAASALARGIIDIFLAFRVKGAKDRFDKQLAAA
jgi:uncharacterized membrane protein HdeD (DUF308 family)